MWYIQEELGEEENSQEPNAAQVICAGGSAMIHGPYTAVVGMVPPVQCGDSDPEHWDSHGWDATVTISGS
jgi:hypothetical protein